jgi:hypothetical protein
MARSHEARITDEQREEAYDTYGGSCILCGWTYDEVHGSEYGRKFGVHHIRGYDAPDEEAWLVPLCGSCNLNVTNSDEPDYRWLHRQLPPEDRASESKSKPLTNVDASQLDYEEALALGRADPMYVGRRKRKRTPGIGRSMPWTMEFPDGVEFGPEDRIYTVETTDGIRTKATKEQFDKFQESSNDFIVLWANEDPKYIFKDDIGWDWKEVAAPENISGLEKIEIRYQEIPDTPIDLQVAVLGKYNFEYNKTKRQGEGQFWEYLFVGWVIDRETIAIRYSEARDSTIRGGVVPYERDGLYLGERLNDIAWSLDETKQFIDEICGSSEGEREVGSALKRAKLTEDLPEDLRCLVETASKKEEDWDFSPRYYGRPVSSISVDFEAGSPPGKERQVTDLRGWDSTDVENIRVYHQPLTEDDEGFQFVVVRVDEGGTDPLVTELFRGRAFVHGITYLWFGDQSGVIVGEHAADLWVARSVLLDLEEEYCKGVRLRDSESGSL